MASVTAWLRRELALEVNAEKSRVAPTSKTTYLGFRFWGTKICWSETTLRSLKLQLKDLTRRNWGVSMGRRMRELAVFLRGWMGYFGLSEHYRPVPDLDSWLRRRVRMCYWRTWRRIRTRIRRLIALGVPHDWAVKTGMSSKGPWHMSRNRAINAALSNQYLARQGLVSIRDLWIRFGHLRRTA